MQAVDSTKNTCSKLDNSGLKWCRFGKGVVFGVACKLPNHTNTIKKLTLKP